MPMVAIVGDTNRAAFLEEHDPGMRARPKSCRPGVQGADPRRARSSRIPELMRRAFAVATSGRPGPVVRRRAGGRLPRRRCRSSDEDFAVDAAHVAAPALRCRPDRADDRARRGAARQGQAARSCWPAAASTSRGAADALHALSPSAAAIPVAHTMTGKGAIACTDPLSAGLFGRYDRIANDADRGVRLPARRRLQARRDRDQALHRAAEGQDRSSTSTSSPRRSAAPTEPEIALWGDARAGLEDLAEALSAAPAARPRAPNTSPRSRARMGEWRDERRRALHLERGAGQRWRACMRRAQPA